jgi:hypothetical protein
MFFGIIIRMFHNDHNPPHFHAEYQGQAGVFDFDGNMTAGSMRSKTAHRLIRQWAQLHRAELERNWDLAMNKQEIEKIDPLD